MSVWAERVARAVDEGRLYVTAAEWEGLVAASPAPPAHERHAPASLTGLPVAVDDERATAERRRAEAIVRADMTRLPPISRLHQS